MGYHERNNLFLWLTFQPKIMDSHPFHLSMLELGGTRVDVSVMTPLKRWDFFGGKMTHQPSHPLQKKRLGPLPDDSPDPYPLLIGFFLGWRQVDVTLMHPELISFSWLFKRCSQKGDKSWNPEMLQLMSLDTTQCTDPEPPKQLLDFSASHQKNFRTVLLNLRASMKTEAAKICWTPRISLFDLRIGTPRTGPHWLNFWGQISHMLELQNVF